MGGAPLLLAIAVVTVDAGWESDGRDGYRYIIQIPAEQLHEVERTGEITSQLPEPLRGRVSSVVVKVGDGPLPRPDVPPIAETPPLDSAGPNSPEAADSSGADEASELNDAPAEVAPADGSPADGSPADGSPADGSPADGSPANGSPANGSPADGSIAAGESQVYLPSPEETVRAQGDANGFGLPGLGRSTATDRGSRVETPPPGTTANSYGTSQFSGFGFETQSRGTAAAPSTTGSSGSSDAPSTSRSTAPSSTLTPSTSRSTASGAAATPPATGFAAADGSRDNRWFSGSQTPAGSDSSSATATTNPPASSSPATSSPSSAGSPTTGSPASGSAANGPASTGTTAGSAPGATPPASDPTNAYPPASRSSATTPPASRSDNAASAPTSGSSPWAFPRDDRGTSSNPPSLSSGGDYSSSPSGFMTAEERQREADRRLLEEVGINASGHAYDKRTNQPLYENDERYPLIVDYVRRMEQAEKAQEPQPAAPLSGRSSYDDRTADRYPPTTRTTPPPASDRSSGWGYDANYDGRGGTNPYPNGYSPAPSYSPNYPNYGQAPANQPPAGNWQTDPRVAQNPAPQTPPATTPAPTTADPVPAASESRTSRSDSPSDFDDSSRTSKSRDATVKTQPLFMFLLLLSIVGNIYLGIAISRLIRRYRNLVATQRGTALTA